MRTTVLLGVFIVCLSAAIANASQKSTSRSTAKGAVISVTAVPAGSDTPITARADRPHVAKNQTRPIRSLLDECTDPTICPFDQDPGGGGGTGGEPAPCARQNFCQTSDNQCRQDVYGCRYRRDDPSKCEPCSIY